MKKRKPQERHVFRVKFHDATTCHVIATSASAAMRYGVKWLNALNQTRANFGKPAAIAPYDDREVRSVEHIAKIDTIREVAD